MTVVFLLIQLRHEVILLRQALPADSLDDAVPGFCYDRGYILEMTSSGSPRSSRITDRHRHPASHPRRRARRPFQSD